MSVCTRAAAIAVALACTIPASAEAQNFLAPPTYQFPATHGAHVYLRTRSKVVHRLGVDAAGRNIVKWGLRFKWVSQDHTRHHWFVRRARWIAVWQATQHLKHLLRAADRAAKRTRSRSRARLRQVSSGWAIPTYVVMCESGGQNLPPNSAGASGYYQIIPSTWASYGGTRYASAAYLAGKWAQDIIARRIWANSPSNWVCA